MDIQTISVWFPFYEITVEDNEFHWMKLHTQQLYLSIFIPNFQFPNSNLKPIQSFML